MREITSPFMEFFVKARVVIRSSCRVQAKFTTVNASFFYTKEVNPTCLCTVGGGALQKQLIRNILAELDNIILKIFLCGIPPLRRGGITKPILTKFNSKLGHFVHINVAKLSPSSSSAGLS